MRRKWGLNRGIGRPLTLSAYHAIAFGALSLIGLLISTYLTVFTNAGLGLFAATIARNIAQLGLLAILMVVPLILLSGTWTPPEAMPAWMRIGTFILPMRHYVDVSYGILLKGAGVDLLWDSLLTMAVLGGGVFSFGGNSNDGLPTTG